MSTAAGSSHHHARWAAAATSRRCPCAARPDAERPGQHAGATESTRPVTPRSCVPVLLNIADGQWLPMHMELGYERRDPFAVELAFYGPAGAVARWRFSRELLLSGMDGSAGEGEVRIWPSEESSAGRALFLRLGPAGGSRGPRGSPFAGEPLARPHLHNRSSRPGNGWGGLGRGTAAALPQRVGALSPSPLQRHPSGFCSYPQTGSPTNSARPLQRDAYENETPNTKDHHVGAQHFHPQCPRPRARGLVRRFPDGCGRSQRRRRAGG
ncbi:SsgA family sporulation/cell division regulator [Streptomyces rubiginosohelvolus]